jgi:hypothetical protein
VAKINPQPVKVFTREDPCTKVHLFNCFNAPSGFRPRAVVEARGEIGINAIKYLLRQGYAEAFEGAGADWWKLTAEGEQWLTTGLQRHLELHPEERSLVEGNAPAKRKSGHQASKVLRRTRR